MAVDTFLDSYSLKARLAAAALVVMPLAVGIAAFFPPQEFTYGILAGGLAALAANALLSQVARDLGRKKQPSLWRSWGGPPTLRSLRHKTSGLPAETLERYHRRLGAKLRMQMPTLHDEEIDPATCDGTYTSCVDFLRDFTRNRENFPLVFAENVNYGYRRNLWAMKPAGVGSTFIGLILCVVAGSSHWVSASQVASVPLLGTLFNVLLLVWWCLRINPSWVREAAEEYAKQLLSACERLDEPALVELPKEKVKQL